MEEDLESVKVAISAKYIPVTSETDEDSLRFLLLLPSSGFSLSVRVDVRHAEGSQKIIFTPHSLRVKYQGSEGSLDLTLFVFSLSVGSMLIDYLSVRNLELVQNLQSPKSPQCLYGILDHCHTPMGKRLLRASILQPSAGSSFENIINTDLNTLEARLDAVQEMIQTEDMYHGVSQGKLPLYSDSSQH